MGIIQREAESDGVRLEPLVLRQRLELLGVVFAASVSDKQTGYALTATQVAGAVKAAARSDGTRVSSGNCT